GCDRPGRATSGGRALVRGESRLLTAVGADTERGRHHAGDRQHCGEGVSRPRTARMRARRRSDHLRAPGVSGPATRPGRTAAHGRDPRSTLSPWRCPRTADTPGTTRELTGLGDQPHTPSRVSSAPSAPYCSFHVLVYAPPAAVCDHPTGSHFAPRRARACRQPDTAGGSRVVSAHRGGSLPLRPSGAAACVAAWMDGRLAGGVAVVTVVGSPPGGSWQKVRPGVRPLPGSVGGGACRWGLSSVARG